MKNLFFIILLFSLVSCGSEPVINNCFQTTIPTTNFTLNTPQLNGLLTPSGTAEVTAGSRNIVLFNKGTSGGSFSSIVALDRECPKKDCNTPMTIDSPFLECACDGIKYSMLNGCPITGNCDCGARRYTVTQNGASLQISN